MKIIDAIWFSQMGSMQPIGIVIGEDEHAGKPTDTGCSALAEKMVNMVTAASLSVIAMVWS